jgi:hypothetical protein
LYAPSRAATIILRSMRGRSFSRLSRMISASWSTGEGTRGADTAAGGGRRPPRLRAKALTKLSTTPNSPARSSTLMP